MFEKIKASDGNTYTPDAVFTDSDGNRVGVIGQETTPGLSADEMQRSVEAVVREIVIPAYNDLVDALNALSAAGSVGAEDGSGGASDVQSELAKRIITGNIKYIRLNSSKEIETSEDGTTWTGIAPAGHAVIDADGNPVTQRQKIKFVGATVSDDGTQTVITGFKGEKGNTGPVIVPSVSDDGVMSFTIQDTATAPPPVNVKGEPGYTPVKGVDYFTESDKQEIAGEAAELVPVATTEAAGKVKPSSDFEVAEDGTLSIYTPIKVSVREIIPQIVEEGSTIKTVNAAWTQNKNAPFVATLKLSPTSKKTLTGEGKGAGAVNGAVFRDLDMKADADITVVVNDGRQTATLFGAIGFYPYSYTRVGKGYTPLDATGYVRQATEQDFQTSGATFQYEAGDRIYFTGTSENCKIQTNVLGQWADVNTTKVTAEDGSDEFEFEQKNLAKRNVHLFATDEFTASGSAKYRIITM